ncbi:hypothetical protein I6N90_00430 [Paenibacillus sp. GSMTC-2017]|uniref:hypothetical protein n=1 Tax=Paenibacillus sp. GSMTC-2017 TaxID=2794350 RepID=UPI0018D5F3B3|nr:hypothetical protein [Paenibacillus sp. GSMTC-2017]MBH5316272.1 hypothetical protein [Paenibacillus sp. GSMTC-2017]
MNKDWEFSIPIKTKKAKLLLGLSAVLFVLFIIWFIRFPVPANGIVVNELTVSGKMLLFDGSFKNEKNRYRSYSLKTNSTGDVVIRLYAGFIGSSKNIHFETKTRKNIKAVYLYSSRNSEGKKIWPVAE